MPSSRPSRLLWFFLALAVGAGLAIWFGALENPEDPNARRTGPFLATPYLQLGAEPGPDRLALLWHADDRDAAWAVEVRSPEDAPWKPALAPESRPIRLEGVEPQRVYRATLAGLAPGRSFRYRVLLGGKPEFEATAGGQGRARPAAAVRGLRRLRGEHLGPEEGRLPGFPGEARPRPDHRRHRLFPGASRRVPGQVLPDLRRARPFARPGGPAARVDPLRRRAGQPRPDGQRLRHERRPDGLLPTSGRSRSTGRPCRPARRVGSPPL